MLKAQPPHLVLIDEAHVVHETHVLRLCPEEGKFDCIVIDHAGNLLLNDRTCDTLPDRLDMGDGEPVDRRKQDKNPDQEKKTKPCPSCSFLFTDLLRPHCWHEILVTDGVAVATGRLVKLEDRRKKLGPASKQQIYAELLGYARERGKKDGWAQYAYQAFMKETIGRCWYNATQPAAPSAEMQQWVKDYNVRRAKSKQRFG